MHTPDQSRTEFIGGGRDAPKPAVDSHAAKWCFVRIADIDVHRTEGLLRSLSFEFERYSSHAYHVDDRAS